MRYDGKDEFGGHRAGVSLLTHIVASSGGLALRRESLWARRCRMDWLSGMAEDMHGGGVARRYHNEDLDQVSIGRGRCCCL